MAKASQRRALNLKRRRAVRDPRRRFLIVCEGKNSEPLYLQALERASSTIIDIIAGAGTPEVIAETAIQEATRRGVIGAGKRKQIWYEKTDEVWAVFDRDEHQYYDDALRLCQANGIGIGRSNPCFEVWLVLHFEDYHRPDGRAEVLQHLCDFCPEYAEGKGRKTNFGQMIERLEVAERRAEAQLAARRREGDEGDPPSTTIFLLTRSIWKKRC